jgi:hypothetical protein
MFLYMTTEERVLLESRLERASQSWQLVGLIDISPHDIDSPWLTIPKRDYEPPTREYNIAALAAVISKHKLVIAGGWVVKFLLLSCKLAPLCDIDIFSVGEDTQVATERIFACMRDLIALHACAYQLSHSEHQMTLSFIIDRCTFEYQFILRLYPSIAHIIGGFDISVSQHAWDGERFYATKLGAWSFEHECILVDVTRSSPSHGSRLMKYNRWFDIVFVGVTKNDIKARYAQIASLVESQRPAKPTKESRYGFYTARTQIQDQLNASATQEANRMLELCGYPHLQASARVKIKIKQRKPDPAHMLEFIKLLNDHGVKHEIWNNRHIISLRYTTKVGEFTITDDMTMSRKQPNYVDYGPYKTDWLGRSNSKFVSQQRYDLVYVVRMFDPTMDPATILTFVPVFKDEVIPELLHAITERRRSVHWITENPGRQWTASFDPTPITGPVYYGELYTGRINHAHIIRVLWLGWKYDSKCLLRIFPRDMMNMLTWYTLCMLAEY